MKARERVSVVLDTLMYLSINPSSTRTELAEGLGVPVGTASKYLKVLNGLNVNGKVLVKATESFPDARKAWLHSVTEAGQEVLEALTPIDPLFSEDWKAYKAGRR